MGGGGDSGSGYQVNEIRYAQYVETHHEAFLNTIAGEVAAAMGQSPYEYYDPLEIDNIFFGIGYVVTDFPSLYDIFGKFVAALDIEVLLNQAIESVVNAPAVNNLISQQAQEYEDDIIENARPRFDAGMMDINAVQSSTFIVGHALMETGRMKSLAKFDTELRYRLIPTAISKWQTHLDWNKYVPAQYAEIIKFYITGQLDTRTYNINQMVKHILWNLNTLGYQGSALGALQGAMTTKTTTDQGGSTWGNALGSTMAGGAAGALVGAEIIEGTLLGMSGGVAGLVIGGMLGLASAFL